MKNRNEMKKMITSIQNSKVKTWRKLHKRKERMNTKTFLVEGYHLIEEAWKSDWNIHEIIVEQGSEVPEWCGNFPVVEVNDVVFSHIAQTKTPQGIAAVIEMKQTTVITGNYVLLIDAIQDPGNLGTIIRTADAAGFDAVCIGGETVDLYNDKVIRATQGSLFHIPIIQTNLPEQVARLKTEGFNIWATALKNAKIYHQIEVDEKVAIIVGNEGAGIQTSLLQAADTIVTIPIYGQAESLNVSVAAGILMYYVKG